MSASTSTFEIPPGMHPMSVNLAAIEVMDLARLHLDMAGDALQHGNGELHDWHECRAYGLAASVREAAPEIVERDAHADLKALLVRGSGQTAPSA